MILLQAITVLFSIFCALLNEVPVIKMINTGASLNEEKQFHRANAAVKIVYALAVTLACKMNLLHSLVFFHLLLLIQWLVFDIALNLILHKVWDYVGETAWLDKKLNKYFPHGTAGEIKALVCMGLIIILNLILQKT